MTTIPNNIHLPINFQILDNQDVDDTRYTKVKIWLLHLGMNESKGIYFPREVVNESLGTLKNVPILSHIDYIASKGKPDFTDHQVNINSEGEIEHKTQVIGVIPESNNAKFEKRLCDDFIEREFLTVEGLIWNTRANEELSILKETGVKGQSMELYSNDTEFVFMEDGSLKVTKMSYDGACILGDHVEPAMINSTIELFTKDIKTNELISIVTSEIQYRLSQYQNKGGNKMKDSQLVCNKCGTVTEKDKACSNCGNTTLIPKDEFEKSDNKDKANTNAKKPEKKTQKSEDNAKGGSDKSETDKDKKDTSTNKKKEEKEKLNNSKSVKDTTKTSMENKDFQAKIAQLEKEINQLREFKNDVMQAEIQEQKDALFSKYEAIQGLPEFQELKQKASEYSVEELDKEFALIFANNIDKIQFSKLKKDSDDDNDSTNYNFTSEHKNSANKYSTLLSKYGYK